MTDGITLLGRSSSHFTRAARMFALDLGVPVAFRAVLDMTVTDPAAYGENPALKVPVLIDEGCPLFGTENICRELARRSGQRDRAVLRGDVGDRPVANAEELIVHAMQTDVVLVMQAMGGASGQPAGPADKARRSLENALSFLDAQVDAVIAALPPDRIVSFCESALYCLVTHLPWRKLMSVDAYGRLAAFCAAAGATRRRRPSTGSTSPESTARETPAGLVAADGGWWLAGRRPLGRGARTLRRQDQRNLAGPAGPRFVLRVVERPAGPAFGGCGVDGHEQDPGGGELLGVRWADVGEAAGQQVFDDGRQRRRLLVGVGELARHPEQHDGTVIERVVKRRAGQHQPVEQSDGHAQRRSCRARAQEAAGLGAVKDQLVAPTPVGHPDHDRRGPGGDAHEADQPFVENAVDHGAVIRAALGDAPDSMW
jgi:glutathione S-transferase